MSHNAGSTVLVKDNKAQRKIVRISGKRQITIPQRYYEQLGFDSDAVCYIDGDAMVIKPLSRSGREFSEFILADLIKEGYEGEALLDEFIHRQGQVRPAVEQMIAEAEQAATKPENYTTIEAVFGHDY
jgi:bifunctional DNA-binding transcriptional regulator/antitoxin component of YhaV-PrlF toxin-antitoxin module